MFQTEQFTHSLIDAWMRKGDPDVVQGLVETALHRVSTALPADLLASLGAEVHGEAVQLPGVSWLKPAATTGGFQFGDSTFEITRFISSSGIPQNDEFFVGEINPWWDFQDPMEALYLSKVKLTEDAARNRELIIEFLHKRSA